ncbi:MAG TPA: metallopeptidase TldD-related protein [Actinomycetes bacterium]|nr:metallopeptidase TldD-related protein [Actinomycetes bacterium]
MKPQQIVEQALDARTVDESVVIVHENSSANLRWAANTLTTNGVMRGRSVTVISTVNQASGAAVGVVSGSVADSDDVARLVHQAEQAAKSGEAAPDSADFVTASTSPDYEDPAAETSAAVFSSFAPALGNAFGRARSDDRELFGFAEHDLTTTYVGSSTGTRLRHVQPSGRVEITGKSANRTRSTWVGAPTQDFSDIDVDALDANVVERLGWAKRQLALDPGRYDVVLPPTAVADLMIYLYWTAAARDAAEGRTVFSKPGGGTRIGDQLSKQPLTLLSDPNYPGMHCAPFVIAEAASSFSSVFDNGIPLGRTEWTSAGTLSALGQTRHSAELTKLPLTPIIDNLALESASGSGSLTDLVSGVERGLLLTTLWYIREVDPQTLLLTGLTRDGVYLVEGGEVVGAVNNFRFNESPVDLLSRVTQAGATGLALPREWADFFTRVAMPPLRVADFNMSTVSQAS